MTASSVLAPCHKRPIRGIFALVCPRAASGHATAAPSTPRNARRFMSNPRLRLRPLAIFEKCQKRRSSPHSVTAWHSGSRGKHRNRVTTWSCRSTGLPDGQISKNLSSPLCKNISVFPKYKSGYINSHPVPQKRGVAQRHQRGAGCGGRGGARDGRCQCGRRSRVVLTPRRWCQVRGETRGRWWQESPVTRESAK